MMKQAICWIVLVMIVSSCTTLFGPSPAKLAGKWVMSGVEGDAGPSDRRRVEKLRMTFEEDGSVTTDLPGTMEYIEGTYQLEKKKLTMIFEGRPVEAIILSLDEDELWIQPLDEGEEMSYTLKFKRF